ncbi:MAG: single-stranded DNA-binding protein [Chloroflexi bacterium]|nr:single-stranded DNA-binding protein [Anaerolineaceae bacterium]NMB89507.1 single-stranded DNA-binding protein [Chloroflexota bacterium]
MPALNLVQLIGRLGKDPESRFTPRGRRVTTFSLAVDRRWKTSQGEDQQATDWFNIEMWGALADVAQRYLQKGRLVYLSGRLQTDRYEEGGETRYFTKVVAQQMQMLDWPEGESEQALQAGAEPDPSLESEEEVSGDGWPGHNETPASGAAAYDG